MLINFYIIGEFLDDIGLRRAATQAMANVLKQGHGLPSPGAMALIWPSIPRGSLFRKQLVDYAVARVNRELFINLIAQFPPQFVEELAAAALRKAPCQKWKDAMGDASQYLEPEESNDNTSGEQEAPV